MTKEEAIRVLDNALYGGGNSFKMSEFRDAVKLALGILKETHVPKTAELGTHSLPSNLDEAAEKYAEDIWLAGENWGDAARRTFKAGAEWMAGQGWRSVDERLPKMDEEVIVLSDELGTALIYKISFGHIVDVNRCIDYNGWNVPGVKYWIPCPEIPKITIKEK